MKEDNKYNVGDVLIVENKDSYHDEEFTIVKEVERVRSNKNEDEMVWWYWCLDFNERQGFGMYENNLRRPLESEIYQIKEYLKDISKEYDFIKSAIDKLLLRETND